MHITFVVEMLQAAHRGHPGYDNMTSQTCPYKDCGTSGGHCVLYWEACQPYAGQYP